MNLIDYNNGTVTVTTSGGTAPYSFLLQQNGQTFTYSGSNFVNPISSSSGTVVFGNANDTTGASGLPAGDYTCQITDSNGCVVNTPTLTVQQDISATTTAAPTYTVTINAVADPANIVGSHPLVSTGNLAGSSYTIPGPTWSVTGFTFIGYDTYSGTPMAAPQYQPGDILTITGDVNLYARYQVIPTTTEATTTIVQHPVTYQVQPGQYSSNITGQHPSTSSVAEGTTISLGGPTWSLDTPYANWIFDGYALSDNLMAPVQYQPGDSYTVNGPVTFYARYSAPPTTAATTTEATTTEATTTEATTTEATTTEATTTEATTTEATTTEATTTEATTTEATTTEATTTEATTTEATTTEATTTEATTTEATTTEATTTEATTTEATTTEATTTEATTTEATTTEATTTEATTTEATTTEATTTEATTTEATTTEATTTEATTTEATTTEATTTEATTTEATTTEATTTEATTTEATTTEATTTIAQDETTFYHFHMGGSTYPFTDVIGTGTAYMIGDGSYTPYPLDNQTNVDLIMTDLIDNSNGAGSTCTPGTFEFAGPIDGTNGCNGSWNHNLTGGDDYYYLAVPNNASFQVNLVTDGLLQESCSGTYNASDRRAFTYNGESYWLYKMINGQGSIAKTFNFK